MIELIRRRCTEVESGGRMIDAILTNTVLPAVSREILVRLKDGTADRRRCISASPDDGFAYAFGVRTAMELVLTLEGGAGGTAERERRVARRPPLDRPDAGQ